MSEPVALPELPEPLIDIGADLFTAEQMHEYAISHGADRWKAGFMAGREERTPAVALSDEQRDAARYRWLLETCGDHLHGLPSLYMAFDDDIGDYRPASFWSLRDPEKISATIDAAVLARATERGNADS